jgi:LysM repeat protein
MARYQGKHRKPSSTSRSFAKFAMAGAVVATPIAIAAPAANASTSAATGWDALAQCESSGNWAANTGNGFSGGLQFTPSTWAAYGGTQYSSNAATASREQQIAVAEKVLAAQGPGAWPVCSVKVGFSGDDSSSSSSSSSSASVEETSAPQQQPSPPPAPRQGQQYTVQAGDTLGKIAQQFGVDWHELFQHNSDAVHDPNLIFPGQQISVQ